MVIVNLTTLKWFAYCITTLYYICTSWRPHTTEGDNTFMLSHQLLYTCSCCTHADVCTHYHFWKLNNVFGLDTMMCTLVHILCLYVYNAVYVAISLDGFVLYCTDSLLSAHFLVSVYRITKLLHLQQCFLNATVMHGVNAYIETMFHI